MPAQVADFISDQRTITVTHNNRKLQVTYRPSRYNSGYIKRLEDLREEENSAHKIGVFSICTLVKSWDMVGPFVVEVPMLDESGEQVVNDFGVEQYETKTLVRDGEPIPVTSDVVKYFSQDFMSALLVKINEDMDPKQKPFRKSSSSRSSGRTSTTDAST
jgi:hypothetical protein